MTNRYYRKFEIVDAKYYQPPTWIRANFDDVPSREITIQQGDRLDNIAQQLYGDPSLWKALAIFNNIGYFFELQPGDKLSVPLKIKDVTDRL